MNQDQWTRAVTTVVGDILVGYGCQSIWGWPAAAIAIGACLVVTMQIDRFD